MTQETKMPLPRRTVEATVVGHEIHNGKPLVKLEIPAWQSQYPINLYNPAPEVQEQLPMGNTLRIVLQADRIKDGQDGSKPWMYFWSFASLAGDDPIDQTPSETGLPARDTMDVRGSEIHLSVALQQAVLYTQGHADPESVSPDEVVEIARVFYRFLREG